MPKTSAELKVSINAKRLMDRINELAKIGATPDGGAKRLALTAEDKTARDLICGWMKEAGLNVTIDKIGNVFGLQKTTDHKPYVLTGSHIDTVTNGGHLDGNLGVIAGLEAIESIQEQDIALSNPLAVAVFTNEEGVRYSPDMMGSGVYAGHIAYDDVLKARASDGSVLEDDLRKIGYLGSEGLPPENLKAFIELHIEQGPLLEKSGDIIGAVEHVQGIHWQRLTIKGVANHAGTTPMSLRHDPSLVAGKIISFVRQITEDIGGDQRGTVGQISFKPNLINVIPAEAELTVDIRNSDKDKLQKACDLLKNYIVKVEAEEGVSIESEILVDLDPVQFSEDVAELIEKTAKELGLSSQRMISGAGHDAQMIAPLCPTAMIFVPSINGISHNPKEATSEEHLIAGANVLANCMVKLSLSD